MTEPTEQPTPVRADLTATDARRMAVLGYVFGLYDTPGLVKRSIPDVWDMAYLADWVLDIVDNKPSLGEGTDLSGEPAALAAITRIDDRG